jgi:hypothetical protein
MDLFVDKSYKLHCENKLNYFDALYSPTSSLPSGYTFRDSSGQAITQPPTVVRTGNAVIAYKDSGIGEVHLVKDSNGAFMEELRISEKAKKFVLE